MRIERLELNQLTTLLGAGFTLREIVCPTGLLQIPSGVSHLRQVGAVCWHLARWVWPAEAEVDLNSRQSDGHEEEQGRRRFEVEEERGDRPMSWRQLGSPPHEELRHLLIEMRRRAGLTQEQVAEPVGGPQRFISRVERGLHRVTVVELIELAAAIVDPAAVLRRGAKAAKR